MTDYTPQKTCRECGKQFPATPEYFHRAKRTADGLRYECKSCIKAYQAEYKKRPEVIARTKAYRSDPEVRARHNEQMRRFRKENPDYREHVRLYMREYNRRPDVKERDRARISTPEAREKRNSYLVEYRRRPEVALRLKEYYRDPVVLEKKRQFWRDNVEKRKEKEHRRRTRKLAGGHFTAADVRLQMETQKRRCWWCGGRIKGTYHIDHRIPLSKGGSNDAGNICISCPTCNLTKSDKMPWEFNGRLL
jgi:hypothetical protein